MTLKPSPEEIKEMMGTLWHDSVKDAIVDTLHMIEQAIELGHVSQAQLIRLFAPAICKAFKLNAKNALMIEIKDGNATITKLAAPLPELERKGKKKEQWQISF